MVADTKKVQTLINRTADVLVVIKSLEAIKDTYTNANPPISVIGTPLEGNIAAVNTLLNDLMALANGPVAQGLLDAYVPTHTGDAL